MEEEVKSLVDQMVAKLAPCPHCTAEAQPCDLDDTHTTIVCQGCGAMGPVSVDNSPATRLTEAATAWNRRDLTDKRVLAAKAGVDAETGLAASALESFGKDLLRNIFGRVDSFIVILLDSKRNHVSLVKHRLEEADASKVVLGVAKGIEAGAARETQVAKGGIILPSGVRL